MLRSHLAVLAASLLATLGKREAQLVREEAAGPADGLPALPMADVSLGPQELRQGGALKWL